jgi:hypothetical protein
VDLLDEVLEHLLRIVKSAITPSFIGRDGGDVARRAPEHLLRGETHGLNGLLAVGRLPA